MFCGNVEKTKAANAIRAKHGIEYGPAYQWVKTNGKTILEAITTDGQINWEGFTDTALDLWETQNGT